MRKHCWMPWLALLLWLAFPLRAAEEDTYSEDSILREIEDFFGETTEGLAKAVEKVFKDYGRPNAYIKGEDVGGALVVGVRYGDGILQMKDGRQVKVYWKGPSVGFDWGAAASKVFILVYHLPEPDAIFQRFPGVEGSLYYVGGVGVHYLKRGDIVLAPIRLGAGLRTGANVGYMHFTRKRSWNPF